MEAVPGTAAAIAREVLAIYRDESIVDGVRLRAAEIERAFAKIAEIPGVVRVRSLGMVGAADLGEGGYSGKSGELRPLGDTVYVAPPLNIPMDELTSLLEIVELSIRDVLRQRS